MAVAAAIAVAEVAAEALAETAAETVAESTAEVVAETAAESAAETAAETVAETAAETVAETAAETAAEAAAETAAEEAAETAAEESVMSGILSKVVKIGALVTLGLGVVSIVDLIKADTGSGIKKCSLDSDTKKKLEATKDALHEMITITSKWSNVLHGLSTDTDFGSVNVDVKGEKKSIHVSSLFWGILNDTKKELTAASKISKECSENCQWKANIDVFTLHTVNALTSMMSLCDLREKSTGLQRHNVPGAGDKQAIRDILEKDFPTWKDYIIAQAKKHLNKALVKQASTNATNAILPIVKQPIKQQVMAQAKAQVLPNIIKNAKSRGKSAAKRVFDDRRGHIIAIGLIPFYGWVKSQILISDAKRDAINDARNAAKASVIDDFNSAAVKNHMKQISTGAARSVFAERKTQVDETIKREVNDTLNHHKPVNTQLLTEIKNHIMHQLFHISIKKGN